MRPERRDDFTIAIICTLPIEGDAVEALFDETYDRSCKRYGKQQGDTNSYINGKIGRHNVVLCRLPRIGNGSAASVASSLQTSYTSIQLALVVGICGGAPRIGKDQEIFLGDIVISDSAIEYDFGRQYPSGFQRKTGIKDTLGRPNREIRTLLNAMAARRTREQFQSEIMEYLRGMQQSENRWNHPEIDDILFDSHYGHTHRDPAAECSCLELDSLDQICEEALQSDCSTIGCDKNRIVRSRESPETHHVSIHIGTVGSADIAMKSGQHRENLFKEEKVIAFESTGAGVWDTFPCIILKGVSDYADGHICKAWEAYAAAAAASGAKAFLDYWRPYDQEELLVTRHLMVPFERNPRFVGRQNELVELAKLTCAPGGPSRLAISGLGGTGKTQIALELAYHMHDDDTRYSIFWIPCTTHQAIETACIEIAQRLGIQCSDPTESKDRIKAYLNQTDEDWLLIFDGADDMDMWMNGSGTTAPLKDFLPFNRRVRIIFTTRNRKVAVKLASHDVIHVGDLDEAAGVGLLEKSLIQQDLVQDKDAATYLIKQLAFVPQAITQAAAYMNENGIGVYDYMMLLHEQEEDVVELLSEDLQADGCYEASVNPIVLTWFASFRQIEKLDSLAAEYLSLLACLSQQSISESFLPRPVSRKKMVEALGLLSAYSFITILPGDKCITMHRLVHLAARHWLRSEGRLELYTHKAAERLSEVLNNGHINEKNRRQYVQHAEFLLHELHSMAVQAQWNIRVSSGGDESAAEEEELLLQGTNTLSHNLEP
ncbi:hypothetical protein ASPTUDRAFT_123282 [Aspergillus tubingensis CBS 134.48]|uniref:AAA+ ATPase domain-containing protein n=1 Tax=Aspergillus tubingensis (strain CBS 134.48) TaxID=767770 RepID=A0A1L9N108_ASPTC|nr:hypothetical protein ASPTUDRAFT_123282 [Aspergillus tubingensis CBS 134.48]